MISSKITFQQMQAFLVAARHRSLTKAAEVLFVSQPALSKLIQTLEEELGIVLFERSNKGISLTESGRQCCSVFGALQDNLDSSISFIKGMKEFPASLHIAVPINYDMSSRYDTLKSRLRILAGGPPGMGCLINESLFEMGALCHTFELGGIDLLAAPSFAVRDFKNLNSAHFSELTLCFAVSERRAVYALSDLRGLTGMSLFTVTLQNTAAQVNLVRTVCAAIGFAPGRTETPPNLATVLRAVKNDSCIGLCWHIDSPFPGVRFLPIPHELSEAYLDIAWYPDNLSPQAQTAAAAILAGKESTKKYADY